MASFVVPARSCKGIFAACFLTISFLLTHAALTQTAHFSGALAHPPGGGGGFPFGLAVDARGHIYVADTYDYVYDIGAPYGVAVDSAGYIYYTQSLLNSVTKNGGGVPSITLPLTGLSGPTGIAVDAQGNVFVADSNNSRIVEATPSGNTYTQSTVPTRRLAYPLSVAVDASGNLYIADTDNYRVLKETKAGSGWSESILVNLDTSLGTPSSIAADPHGDVFILQGGIHVLKETLANGVYTQSVLPSYGQQPYAIATDPAGNLYMNSPFENYPNAGILEVLAGPTTTFLPESVGTPATKVSLVFSFDASTTLSAPAVVTEGDTGLDFTNAGTGTCGSKKASFVYNPGDTCFIDVVFNPKSPGSRYGAAILEGPSGNSLAAAYVAGTGVGPQISFPPGKQVSLVTGLEIPLGVAVDAGGTAIVAENGSGNVYKVTMPGASGFSQPLVASGLNRPTAVALDGAGNVYVLASGGLYKETPSHSGYVQTEIPTSLSSLEAIAADRGGNLYLTSSVAGNVNKETLQPNGSYVQSGIGYGISSPRGVAVDGSGNIFVANATDGKLYIETLQASGSYVQTTFSPGIPAPDYLAVDGSGNLYFSNSAQGEIDKLTRQPDGSYVESVARSGLKLPAGLAIDGKGNLYCALGTRQLVMIDVADAPSLVFATAKPGTTSVVDQTVTNIGNDTLYLPWPFSATSPTLSGSAAFAFSTASTCQISSVSGVEVLDPGGSCVYGITFTPSARGSYSGVLTLMDNNLYAATTPQTEQDIALSGASTSSDVTRTSVRVSPNPVGSGSSTTVTVTVADTSNPAIVPQGGVTFTDIDGALTLVLNNGEPVPLTNGKATLNIVLTGSDINTITAHYGGVDASFLSSTGQASLTVQ